MFISAPKLVYGNVFKNLFHYLKKSKKSVADSV